MNARNIICGVILLICVLKGIAIYIYSNSKIKDVESDITILHRKDINEKVEDDEE